MLQDVHSGLLLAAFFIAFLAWYIWDRFFSLQGLPSTLPWADSDGSALSRASVSRSSLFDLKNIIQRGYNKYSKNDQVFVLPNVATGPEVILPMSQMKWLLDQPDHILNQNEVNRQFLHADRTMLHPNIIRDMVHGRVIRREMTKELDAYSEAIVEEIEHSLTLNWGDDINGWREVRIYDTMLDVIARISNRVLVGQQLCRNQDYIRSSSTFSRNVVITAGLINLLPAFLRPVLSPLITAYDKYHYKQITKFIFPIIKQRMKYFNGRVDYRKPDYSKHNDYIQWALLDAFSHDDAAEKTPEMITKRLAVLSFAAIQSSVITIANAIFDLASSPRSMEFQNGLRDEVKKISAERGDQKWKRAALSSMVRIDSTLRESMRLWGFISRGVMKKVVAPNGIRIASGEHLPCGSNVGVTSYAIHHDESAYKDAYSFDAYRFCRSSEEEKEEADINAKDGHSSASMVTSSDHFMAFSHGRHACPGRFFATNQLKLLLAQIVIKYDIEPIESRPPNPWLNNSVGPPMFEKLRVRRRPDTARSPATVQGYGQVRVVPDSIQKLPSTILRKDSFTAGNLLDAKILQTFSVTHDFGVPSPIVVGG